MTDKAQDEIKERRVRLTLCDNLDVTPEVAQWLKKCEDKISEEYCKIENEIKYRISVGLPIVFKKGKLVDIKDIINLPDIKAVEDLSREV